MNYQNYKKRHQSICQQPSKTEPSPKKHNFVNNKEKKETVVINNFYSNEQIDAILASPPKTMKGVSTLDLNLNQLAKLPLEKIQKKKEAATTFESIEWLDKKSSIITAQAEQPQHILKTQRSPPRAELKVDQSISSSPRLPKSDQRKTRKQRKNRN